jgi:hypothetical protein
LQIFSEIDFLSERDQIFVSLKDQIKICKLTILSFHALLQIFIDFFKKLRFCCKAYKTPLAAKAANIFGNGFCFVS